jgi:hypothetical protein
MAETPRRPVDRPLSARAAPPLPEPRSVGFGREVESGVFYGQLALPSLAMATHIPSAGCDVGPTPIQHAPQSS